MNTNELQRFGAIALVGALGVAVPAFAKGGPPPGHGPNGKDTPAATQTTSTTDTSPGDQGKSHGQNGKGHGKAKNVIFKGTVTVKDVGANQVTVDVTAGNHRGQAFKGQVVFDVSKAKLNVSDVNGDGKRDLFDVNLGDPVVVQASLAADAKADATRPFAARRLVDQAGKSGDGSDDGPTSTSPTTTTAHG
jgi:hypothetical protein